MIKMMTALPLMMMKIEINLKTISTVMIIKMTTSTIKINTIGNLRDTLMTDTTMMRTTIGIEMTTLMIMITELNPTTTGTLNNTKMTELTSDSKLNSTNKTKMATMMTTQSMPRASELVLLLPRETYRNVKATKTIITATIRDKTKDMINKIAKITIMIS